MKPNSFLHSLCESAAAAYTLIFLLQLKVMWGLWQYRDLSRGDSAAYFIDACEALNRFRFRFVWSPLFAFVGSSLLRIYNHPYFYNVTLRLLCALAMTMLVLAIMRRLLPAAIALLLAAWWAVLPVNYDAPYEIHQFAALPVLIVFLLLLRNYGNRTARGAALAVAVAAGFLVRTELLLLAVLLAISIAIYESRQARLARPKHPATPALPAASATEKQGEVTAVEPAASPTPPLETSIVPAKPPLETSIVPAKPALETSMVPAKPALETSIVPAKPAMRDGWLKPYLLPLAVSFTLIFVFLIRNSVPFGLMLKEVRAKHEVNIAQVYAVSYMQRHPGLWNGDPWTQSGDLMAKHFGSPELSLTQAMLRNPAAMMEHFLWNLSLVPAGMQVLLFNCASGGLYPGYELVAIRPLLANILSAVCVAVVIGGLYIALVIDRTFTMQWARPRMWCLLAMAFNALLAFVIMLVERPRAEYLFAFSVTIMALIGFCLWNVIRRLNALPALTLLAPITALILCLTVPPHYRPTANGQKLLEYYEFLRTFMPVIKPARGKILVSAYPSELDFYLFGADGARKLKRWCWESQYPAIESGKTDAAKLLESEGIEFVLMEKGFMGEPPLASLNASAHWKLIGLRARPGRVIALFENMLMENK